MIAIADYGIGNLGSVTKAFRRAGAEVRLRDLYAERFDPRLTAHDLYIYEDEAKNGAAFAGEIDAIVRLAFRGTAAPGGRGRRHDSGGGAGCEPGIERWTVSPQGARGHAGRAGSIPPGGVRVSGARDQANAPVGGQDVSRTPGQAVRQRVL